MNKENSILEIKDSSLNLFEKEEIEADRLFPAGAVSGQVFESDQTSSCSHVSHLINQKIKKVES